MQEKRAIRIQRMLSPRSTAFIGGTEAEMAIRRSQELGFKGDIWPVNPKRNSLAGLPCYRTINDLPSVPDAAFVGVNRELTIEVVETLATAGAGGCVCYAAGFAEMGEEGKQLQTNLIKAAGEMPLVGPNCFGFVNYLEQCALWPYLFGGESVERGVALISQSGNIAMNLTMNQRSVNFTHVIGAGNQAILESGDYIDALLHDRRVTAIGMYIEGINDIAQFSQAAARAMDQGVPIVVMKVGKTEASAQQSTTHTSSITGSDALYDALFERLGVIRVNSLNRLLETLKLLHLSAPLTGRNICTLSCSGGEAAITADLVGEFDLETPPFSSTQMRDLTSQFANYVTVSNPLDYNTSIWADPVAMERCFSTVMGGDHDAVFLIYDHPTVLAEEVDEWLQALQAFIAAHKKTEKPSYVISTISELLPKSVRDQIIDNGLVPLQGFDDGLFAYSAGAKYYEHRNRGEVILPKIATSLGTPNAEYLDEHDSKTRLKSFGLMVPKGRVVKTAEVIETARDLGYPVVVKAAGAKFVHKSDLGAVVLGLNSAQEVKQAVKQINASLRETGASTDKFLVEKMIHGSLADLIIGITRDAQFGPTLVIGAGGILVELIADSISLLLPVSRGDVESAINSLKVAKLLHGYRGTARADMDAVVDAVMAIADFAQYHWDSVQELDVNPLLVLPDGQGAIAADALIRMSSVPGR